MRHVPCLFYRSSGLLGDFERSLHTLARVGGNPQGDLCRFGGELLLVVPDGKCIRAQQKSYLSRFARGKGDALKLSQGADRLSDARSLEAKIALDSFDPRARSGVGDICARAQSRALLMLASLQVFIQALRADLCLVDVEISVAEGCVGQAETERKLRTI